MARDLTEIVALAFLLESLVLIARHHWRAATLVLALGVLGRETMLISAVAVTLAWLVDQVRRKSSDIPTYYFLVPFGVYALWQIVLFLHWGQSALTLGTKQFGMPFGGLAPFVLNTLALTTHKQIVQGIELCFLILFAGAVVYSLRSSVVRGRVKISIVAFALWVFLSRDSITLR